MEMQKLPESVGQEVLRGKLRLIGEFRGADASAFEGRQGANKGKVFKKVVYSVETQGATLAVTDFLPDGVEVNTWVPPFKRGDVVVVEIAAAVPNKGRLDLSGKLRLHVAGK